MRKRLFEILDAAGPNDRASKIFDIFLISLIALNVLALVLETEQSLYTQYEFYFHWFDVISVVIFTIEYVLRIYSCTTMYRSRLEYARTPMAIVDLLAIMPFYIPGGLIDLRSLRALRLFRFFRLAKLVRYSKALRAFGRALNNKKEELVITLMLLCILLLFSSSLIYYAEHEAQPDNFGSIPQSMWWGCVTLTTVGYGDKVPVTPLGKFLASLIAIMGIGLFALPAGIMGAAFQEELGSKKQVWVLTHYRETPSIEGMYTSRGNAIDIAKSHILNESGQWHADFTEHEVAFVKQDSNEKLVIDKWTVDDFEQGSHG